MYEIGKNEAVANKVVLAFQDVVVNIERDLRILAEESSLFRVRSRTLIFLEHISDIFDDRVKEFR